MSACVAGPWIIFSLIVSAVSLFVFAALGFQYSFRTHIGAIGFMTILWLGELSVELGDEPSANGSF